MKSNVLRRKEIEKKLSDISDSFEIVSDNLPDNFSDFLTLGIKKDGIYKRVEFAIESAIDILNIINSDLRFGTPENEDGIITNMEKNKILSRNTIENLRRMKGFRNILVHRYGEINDEEAYENISKGLKDFELIIGEIEGFLKERG
jgi:uncharacterized protein YutE (UPF0331/DUF86 family)